MSKITNIQTILKAGVILGMTLIGSSASFADIYYIDSNNGNDASTGLSVTTPWQSLEKIEATNFLPGDEIHFIRGGVWHGTLELEGLGGGQSSGTDKQPIIITSYGTPDLPAPLLDAQGALGAVVSLKNLAFWEVNDLEITNDAEEEADRRGIEVRAENFGLVEHIYLSNLNIHHIKGIIGQSGEAKSTAGIYIGVDDASKKQTRFNDIRIQNNHIHHISNEGIVTRHVDSGSDEIPLGKEWMHTRMTNVLIENNSIHHISKNAMILRQFDGGLVQNNVIHDTALGVKGNTLYTISSYGIVFQYNEGYLNRSPEIQDGAMYDPDLNSSGIIFQYSYSHDNNTGLMWVCTVPTDYGIKLRYNISSNDHNAIITLSYGFSGLDIYNNTLYIAEDTSPMIIYERRTGKQPQTYSFQNNIIYNKSPNATYLFDDSPDVKRTFSHNLFYGFHPENEPEDAHKITADPLLVNPVYSGKGLASVTGFKLGKGSPAINAGILIKDNGGKDYFGVPLSDYKPDIGFSEYQEQD